MNKIEQAARVKALCEYLAAIGHPVSTVQGYEVLARAHGHKNKHVLASASSGKPPRKEKPASALPAFIVMDDEEVPVRPLGSQPYSYAEMVELDWEFDAIIPMPMDQLDVEGMNDYASKYLTGNEAALEDIGYTHVPEIIYGRDLAAYRVTGSVSSPEDFFEEAQQENDRRFYADLAELVTMLVPGAKVVLEQDGARRDAVLVGLYSLSAQPGQSPVALLDKYARTQGANNDEVNEHGADVVATLGKETCPGETDIYASLRLSDLKYAVKQAPRTWWMSLGRQSTLTVQFL